ncbi:divisome protein SepX/GlpR [Corynebacterium sp. 335C]
MSSSLLLVLIIVVWVFVLAPLVVNKREPIRRTSEGLGKTRLLHRGGDELSASRRPRFTGDDVRRRDDADDDLLETVDAEPDGIDGLLIDDAPERDARAADRADAPVDGDVVEGDVVYELEPAHAADAADEADVVDEADAADIADEAGAADAADERDDAARRGGRADAVALTADDLGAADDADEADAADLADAADGADAEAGEAGARPAATAIVAPAGDADPVSADVRSSGPDEGLDAHDAAGDFLVARDRRTAAEKMADRAAAAEAAKAVEEPAGAEAVEEPAAEAGDSADRDLHVVADDELTPDDYAWAAAHRGRGGFDPVAAARYAETRFARRRRTVYGLLAAILVTLVLGFALGGWWWAAPAVAVALTVAYLVTLRRTVVAEQELQARRIAGLKRRRMGVRSLEAEELGIPQRLRRPGAIVVELDDEDPDFADVPVLEDDGFHDDWDGRRASGL